MNIENLNNKLKKINHNSTNINLRLNSLIVESIGNMIKSSISSCDSRINLEESEFVLSKVESIVTRMRKDDKIMNIIDKIGRQKYKGNIREKNRLLNIIKTTVDN